MKIKHHLVFVLITILTLLSASVAPQAATPAYVEPGLLAETGSGGIPMPQTLSVIVTAVDSAAAARAVARVGGTVSSDLWLVDAVAATIPAEGLAALAAHPAVRSVVDNKGVESAQDPTADTTAVDGWVTDYRFPVPWDGSADIVQSTDDPKRYKLAYPVGIDIGADVYFDGVYSEDEYGDPIRGYGINVAVVDSGVYVSDQVKKTLGNLVAKQFIGQADFVGTGQCSPVGNVRYKRSVVQNQGYCWTDYRVSRDGYGHGSHVAGIIWNRLTEDTTGMTIGIAPQAKILSVRALDDNGNGTYEDVIEGIQYVVANREQLNVHILNLSLSAQATTPYFVDPLNRAAEAAWAAGIVVVAAAGNAGPEAETITVPGNDPYMITVGAIDGNRTPGYWADDVLPVWSSTGPTLDGFAKPDVLAPGMNIVSFMYNDSEAIANSAKLVREHPDYSETADLFRMNGTSMATAPTAGRPTPTWRTTTRAPCARH
jgi:hypothetical protein